MRPDVSQDREPRASEPALSMVAAQLAIARGEIAALIAEGVRAHMMAAVPGCATTARSHCVSVSEGSVLSVSALPAVAGRSAVAVDASAAGRRIGKFTEPTTELRVPRRKNHDGGLPHHQPGSWRATCRG